MRNEAGIAYYRQIADILIARIYNGSYASGERLPSDRELGLEFGHNRHTIRRALDVVEAHNLIVRRRGKGTFVAENIPPGPPRTELPIGLIDITRQLGARPAAEVLKVMVQPANGVAARLRINKDDRVIYLHRLRYLEGEPAIVEHIYVPQALCPGLERYDLSQSLHQLMHRAFGLDVTHKEVAFESILSDGYVSQLLKLPVGSPMMLERRILYAKDGVPREYAEHIYRGDRFSFTLRSGQ